MTVIGLLVILAVVTLIGAVLGKCPVWVPVLFLLVIVLLVAVPGSALRIR